MKRFIGELRRREVFRTAGLYVGVSWILIEVSSVLLPTFDAPDWIMRAIVIVTVVGFPVMLVLAWVYDLTEHGIRKQEVVDDAPVPELFGRKMDFVAIGVLTVALIISVYLNFTRGPTVEEDLEPVSVLIADFDNRTGETLFDGLLEQALNIGIEGAPNVTSFQRTAALEQAGEMQDGAPALSASSARLVAVREGIDLVLSGSIEADGPGYRLAVDGLDPETGESLFDARASAASKDAVLAALGELSVEVREELGDETLKQGEDATSETFTAASIEAAQAFIQGQQLAYEGNHEAAVELYHQALEMDPRFGRAHATSAFSYSRLGNTAESEEHWEKALSMMDTMTERERLRTLGVYYASITGNLNSAIDNFRELVEKYPADAAGHNNLAVVYFLTLDFENAMLQGRRILDIYPNSVLYRSNYALYAMYAGDLETSTREALRVIELDPDFYKGYLPLAIAAIERGDIAAARNAYEDMSGTGARGNSLATVGQADLAIYTGDFEQAIGILGAGAEHDLAAGNQRAAATKLIMSAEALAELGRDDEAGAALGRAIGLDDGPSRAVPAAVTYLRLGQPENAAAIGDALSGQLQPQRRAYGLMIQALLDLEQARTVEAVDKLRAATELADLWLIRFHTGRAYLVAGYAAEALTEFQLADDRRGEATAAFLDDTPTYRYLATLPYWLGRAQLELGMADTGRQNLQAFLDLRPNGGTLTEDAVLRLR